MFITRPDDDEEEEEEDEEEDGEVPAGLRPERVMIFTTISLLALLSVVTECFVDGTFKVSII